MLVDDRESRLDRESALWFAVGDVAVIAEMILVISTSRDVTKDDGTLRYLRKCKERDPVVEVGSCALDVVITPNIFNNNSSEIRSVEVGKVRRRDNE